MVTAADIPDWCYVEGLAAGRYVWTVFQPPLKAEIDSMYSASLKANIQSIKAHTFLALQMVDRNIPPSPGLEYYYT